jgi:hypothetical protein
MTGPTGQAQILQSSPTRGVPGKTFLRVAMR